MAFVTNYTFDNMSRIGNDTCTQDQNTIQNISSCNYLLQNYFANDCSMKQPIALATTQPGVFFNGGYNVGAGGCNIDESSKLQIGTIQTHPRCRIDLFQRPFCTVPFLGRGSCNPIVESQIQQGDTNINKKSVNGLSERSYIKYHQTPLLSSVKDRINASQNNNNNNLAGIPSRELTRDADYFKS